MNKVWTIIIILLVFGLSYGAYKVKSKSHEEKLLKENATLKKSNEATMATNLKLSKDMEIVEKKSEAKSAHRQAEIKKVLLIMLPDNTDQINKAFAPPKKKVKVEADAQKKTKKGK